MFFINYKMYIKSKVQFLIPQKKIIYFASYTFNLGGSNKTVCKINIVIVKITF